MVANGGAMKNHRIVITLVIEGDYSHFEANPNFYSNEALTELLGTVFESGTDQAWSIMPGEDTVWIEDTKDLELNEETGRFEDLNP